MKIAITGKGGAGKTTIAAHLGKILSEMNAVGKILLIDADATKNLSTLLGYDNITPVNKIKDINIPFPPSQRRQLQADITFLT